ncbi:MAG: hypothetical protein ACRDGN_16240 [bacterium]
MPRRLAALLLVTAGISLAAPAGTATGQAIKNPDTYVVVSAGDWDSFDYAWAYDVASSAVIANVYETLIVYDGVRTAGASRRRPPRSSVRGATFAVGGGGGTC